MLAQFIAHRKGTSKKTNKPYEVIEVTNGKQMFTLFVAEGAEIADAHEGDEVEIELEAFPKRDGTVGVSVISMK